MDTKDWPAALQTPEYHWWRRAMVRDRLPVHDEDPQCGFYKWRHKPVAIWLDPQSQDMRCRIADRDADMLTVKPDWVAISQEPVTPKSYRWALEHGEWPGHSKVAKTVATELKSNQAPEGPDLLDVQLDELQRDADRLIALGAAKTQAAADEAAKLADVIDKVEKQATEIHKRDKEPHLAAGRQLDRIWFPVRDRASELKKRLKGIVILPFLAADKAKRDYDNAVLVAQGVDASAITDAKPKAAGYGRTTALRTNAIAVIEDYDLLLAHLAGHPDVKTAVAKIANASARAGITLPGMTIHKEQTAV